MREEDLPQVAAIQDASPEAAHWKPADYLAYAAWVLEANPPSTEIYGFVVLQLLPDDEAEILNIAVSPSVRRRGFARALWTCPDIEKQRLLHLEVRESNAAAIAFYCSVGFETISRRKDYYQAPKEAGIVMRLKR